MLATAATKLELSDERSLAEIVGWVHGGKMNVGLDLIVVATVSTDDYTLTELCEAYATLEGKNQEGLAASQLEGAIVNREANWEEISSCIEILPEHSETGELLTERLGKHPETCPDCRSCKLVEDSGVWVCRDCGYSQIHAPTQQCPDGE